MVSLDTNLNNFSYWEILRAIFGGYSTNFVYTATGTFRRTRPPVCPECGMSMNYKGYSTYEKRGLGSVKIGRYTCPSCNKNCEEERSFWKKLKENFFDTISMINKLLRLHHVSYQGISDILALIYPQGRDTIFNAFADSVEKTVIPPTEDIRIVLYDEQHPKKGRTQKFRLTLLDGVTGQPIAEEPYDSKDPATIMAFLVKYLDPNKCTFVVYFVKCAPATNNGVENYYSTSLKTHRKKQLRSDRGIENQMKLSAMKRAGLLGRCKKNTTGSVFDVRTVFDVLVLFWIRIMWIFDRKSMWDHVMVVYYLETR